MTTATDPYDLYPGLDLLQGQKRNNTPHAFYLRVELGRTQFAWQLGKRYVQDEPLKWGCAARCAVGQDTASPQAYKPQGTTLKTGKRRREVP
ncbi:MAG: hypothetical protein M3461_24095 [Pseudomonadota bacterium]|nr:hypothetical protein [Pseudomonadota bacterium]